MTNEAVQVLNRNSDMKERNDLKGNSTGSSAPMGYPLRNSVRAWSAWITTVTEPSGHLSKGLTVLRYSKSVNMNFSAGECLRQAGAGSMLMQEAETDVSLSVEKSTYPKRWI